MYVSIQWMFLLILTNAVLYCLHLLPYGTNRLLSSPIQRHVLRLRKKLSAPSNEAGHDDSLTRMASRNKRYAAYCTVSYAINQSIENQASLFRFPLRTLQHLTIHILHYLIYIHYNNRCPVCQSNQSNPIAIPYETDCGHIYCYTCLWTDHVQHQERNCRICHERIQSCRPVQ